MWLVAVHGKVFPPEVVNAAHGRIYPKLWKRPRLPETRRDEAAGWREGRRIMRKFVAAAAQQAKGKVH